ncbi:MAG: two pore domain potassium channel family protein [Alistipes sp.]|nr:two pore domain potassium channel family protein [Alistipes sp.]
MSRYSTHPSLYVAQTLSLIGALVLIITLSVEIICGSNMLFSRHYMNIQFVVCMIFLYDLTVRCLFSRAKGWFILRNILFLLLSIPWLNMLEWSGWELTRSESMAVAIIPLLRAFLALFVVVRWLVQGSAKQLFIAYLVTVVMFTYLSALIFYDYEIYVNPHLKGFGNALWWAWMNVTTVGAAIFPVTAVGKFICVLLPMLGMAMFPIFTLYVTSLYTGKGDKK